MTSTTNSHINSKSNPHGVTASQIGVYTKSDIDSKVSTLNTSISGKASKATTLSGYGITNAYTKSEVDSKVSDLNTAIEEKANSSHNHSISDVTNLQSTLDEKLPKSGGTLTGTLTITNGSNLQSAEPHFKWKTVGDNTPYIGFAQDQTDGTFILGSLKGVKYQTGLAIGGGSGNLLWKGAKVATADDLAGKANTSHGNHVPATQTASNKVFLRNDNTWATITPANIGAAASSHGTHVSYGTSATAVGATASAGSATTVSRSDHTHSLSKSAVTTALGYTPPTSDTNTTYTFTTGDSNGQIKVTPSGGNAQNVSVKGLGTAAYTASTAYAPASHNHAASNITSGTLPVVRGGTGVTSNPSMLTNLGSTSAASVFAASPRPGVTGVLPIKNGGTGCNSKHDVLAALGLSAITATGSTTDISMPGGTVTKIPLTTKVGYTDNFGVFALNGTNSSGSIEIQGQGLYLICGSVYIKNTAKSGTTVTQAACYIRNNQETELVSGSVDINPSTSRDVCVSTGIKVVALADGDVLSLHARIKDDSVEAVAKASNTGTYLTVIRLCFTVS